MCQFWSCLDGALVWQRLDMLVLAWPIWCELWYKLRSITTCARLGATWLDKQFELRIVAICVKLEGTWKMLRCKPRLFATFTGLEGVWEIQQYKPRLAATCVEIEGPWEILLWAFRPAIAYVWSLKSLDYTLPDLAGWVGLGFKKMLGWGEHC